MSLYDELGVDRSADTATINKAYRKRARKAHPDAGGNIDTFKTIALAHDILSDPEKRARYDATGSVDSSANEIEIAISHLVIAAFGRNDANPLKSVQDEVDRRRSEVRRHKIDLERRKATVVKNLKKFEKSNQKTKNQTARDFIAHCIQANICDLENQIAGCDQDIAKGTAILTYLNDLKFDETGGSTGSSDRSAMFVTRWA